MASLASSKNEFYLLHLSLTHRIEVYYPLKQPILPIKILKNKNYVAIVILAAVGQMAFFCMSVIWPQQIAALYSTDNIEIGWMSVSSCPSPASLTRCPLLLTVTLFPYTVHLRACPSDRRDCHGPIAETTWTFEVAANCLFRRSNRLSRSYGGYNPVDTKHGSRGKHHRRRRFQPLNLMYS